MDAQQLDTTLASLAGIEKGLAKIYRYLAERRNFSAPVRRFWQTMNEEELKHEQLFLELRRALHSAPQSLDIVDLDQEHLREFVGKVNALLGAVKDPALSESDAYSIGAKIEVEFDECGFLRKLAPYDEKFRARLRSVINDCKKHSAMLIAHSRRPR